MNKKNVLLWDVSSNYGFIIQERRAYIIRNTNSNKMKTQLTRYGVLGALFVFLKFLFAALLGRLINVARLIMWLGLSLTITVLVINAAPEVFKAASFVANDILGYQKSVVARFIQWSLIIILYGGFVVLGFLHKQRKSSRVDDLKAKKKRSEEESDELKQYSTLGIGFWVFLAVCTAVSMWSFYQKDVSNELDGDLSVAGMKFKVEGGQLQELDTANSQRVREAKAYLTQHMEVLENIRQMLKKADVNTNGGVVEGKKVHGSKERIAWYPEGSPGYERAYKVYQEDLKYFEDMQANYRQRLGEIQKFKDDIRKAMSETAAANIAAQKEVGNQRIVYQAIGFLKGFGGELIAFFFISMVIGLNNYKADFQVETALAPSGFGALAHAMSANISNFITAGANRIAPKERVQFVGLNPLHNPEQVNNINPEHEQESEQEYERTPERTVLNLNNNTADALRRLELYCTKYHVNMRNLNGFAPYLNGFIRLADSNESPEGMNVSQYCAAVAEHMNENGASVTAANIRMRFYRYIVNPRKKQKP